VWTDHRRPAPFLELTSSTPSSHRTLLPCRPLTAESDRGVQRLAGADPIRAPARFNNTIAPLVDGGVRSLGGGLEYAVAAGSLTLLRMGA
jgi:hypothetical protein